ncbi:hypothetical protein [Paenibacillus glucanolyticus]|uniref:hypothetical protein n=1 Tax=Paenibacillus glucanolyticus TaxID=59843 RepID=UPI0034CFCA29
MVIYQGKYSTNQSDLLKPPRLSTELHLHIMDIMESGPTANFFCRISENYPNTLICLIEENQLEYYTMCHIFSFDDIGSEYSYQTVTKEQIAFIESYLKELNID